MDKQEFVSSVNVDDKLAASAWEQANGDPDKAHELVETDRVIVKGRFSDPDEGFYGLFYVDWSAVKTSLNSLEVVVLSDDSIQDVDPSIKSVEFQSKVEQYQTNDAKMGGYTDQLEKALRKYWSNPQSKIRSALKSGDQDTFEGLHESFVAEALELDELSLVLRTDQRLRVESETSSTSSPSPASDREITIPCEIEINPVKGMPVSKINPGDLIYVELGEVESEKQKVVDRLEDRKDETGMVPAKVLGKKGTAAGNLRIDVEFDDSVKGKVSCGKDVSILVPGSTKQRDSDGTTDFSELLQNEFFIGVLLGVILLVVLGIWYFLF